MAATICDDGNFHRCFVDEEFHFNLVKSLNNLKSHRSLCDITIICGKERISAHKIVLAATSTYFCAMFTSGLCESTLNEVKCSSKAQDRACFVFTLVTVVFLAEGNSMTLSDQISQ